jgi:heavy metal translocating P-type ATPase
MQVRWAVRLLDGREEAVPIAAVLTGDRLFVRPGEAVPTDGVVSAGESELDESALTGESRPRPVRPGDAVLGGTVNLAAALTLSATRVGAATVLARIVRLVDEAQSRKAPTQRLADAVAGHFVSVVTVLAGLTFAFWQWVLPNPYQPAAIVAIAVLIIACPCALGLATPVAVIAGAAAAARRGVLIKGGEVMERAAQVTDVVLDKTGTLTTGALTVTGVESLGPLAPSVWLPLAVVVERQSLHPLATALQTHWAAEVDGGRLPNAPLVEARGVRVLPGRGAVGTAAGSAVAVGNRRLLAEQGVALPADTDEDGLPSVLVYVAVDGRAAGRVLFADPLRPDALAAVTALRQMGIAVHLYSGDRPVTVADVARQTEIADARGAMLPDDKLAAIRALQAQGRVVAMVGDGVNDAPALTQSDLAMAVSTGSDLALETAQVILLRARLMGAAEALAASRRTFRVIQENLWLSIAYNAVAVPLAMAGMVIPLGAAIAMSASSLLVVGNALKLRRRHASANDPATAEWAPVAGDSICPRCC